MGRHRLCGPLSTDSLLIHHESFVVLLGCTFDLRVLREQELRRLGMLHDTESLESCLILETASMDPSGEVEFAVKQNKRFRRRQRPMNLSLRPAKSLLSEDDEIAKWMLTTIAPSTIQYRRTIDSYFELPIIPQSLPPSPFPSVLAQSSGPASATNTLWTAPKISTPITTVISIDEVDDTEEHSWTLIPNTTSKPLTPSSPPEAWVFLTPLGLGEAGE